MSSPAFVMSAPFARIGVDIANAHVTGITIATTDALAQPRDACARQIYQQLQAYFDAATQPLDIPIQLPFGTAYQRQIWAALQRIPCGQTRTYGELAAQFSSNPRAVGNACGANPIPLIIPCHRVLAKTGLGGYMGTAGLDYKRWLLRHEGVEVRTERLAKG